jgi:hypothetical protein
LIDNVELVLSSGARGHGGSWAARDVLRADVGGRITMTTLPLRTIALSIFLALTMGPVAAQESPSGQKEHAPAMADRVMVEIYHIAPGQHQAFLRFIARFDEVNAAAGLPPRQLYVHSDGASWDFMLIQPAEYPPGADERVAAAAKRLGVPGGAKFFLEIRHYIAEHTDTVARGPTTAADFLALLDQ